ncbi:SDR family oxidoreductase [Acaricomes phytoseiuli]|uniref:SDR family NAD(P)-dependent oxidoreductase n=1 Tax=Acaricomes phytoseiuli TaxID=291968 RepID=UPI0022229103|nr:SDR family oxidoreductase [Acaricomes phytoseiuli]MCW1248890.1 SDR family oxidoreductase [Acaricomes phytoseiuli]
MKSLHGKTVVVTGAGSGMGRAYVLEAVRRGAKVAFNDIDAADLVETPRRCGTATILARAVDVSDEAQVDAFAREVEEQLGSADVVINNAGIEGEGQPFWATSQESFDRVMGVDFWAVVYGARAFLPQLLERERGYLVNVSSLFGLVGPPHHTDYSAAKFAVRGFSESLAAELLGTSVMVYTIHPGGVATRITRRQATQAFHQKYLRTEPAAIARCVFDRLGSPRTRIVCGNRAQTTWLGARLLPQRLMNRLTSRDLGPILDRSAYPVQDWLMKRRAESRRGRS